MLIALAVVAAHLLLALPTADWLRGMEQAAREKKASKRSSDYIKAVLKSNPACREDLIPCIRAFRDYLAERRIKLRVVLRPEISTVMTSQGSPQLEPNAQAAALMAAEHALKKEGVVTVNLLPPLHREICLREGAGVQEPTDSHFTRPLIQFMANVLENSKTEHQRAHQGRHLLLVGDCYATLITSRLVLGDTLPGTRSLWKNSGDTLMAYEISRVPPEVLDGVREIYWCLSALNLQPGSKAPLPLPRPRSNELQGKEDPERTIRATLTRLTVAPENLGRESPYPNALIAHEFTTEDGEKLLAIVQIMEARTVNPAVKSWLRRKPYVLTLQPWHIAVEQNPALGREQLMDEIQDFTAERYYVKDWTHAP